MSEATSVEAILRLVLFSAAPMELFGFCRQAGKYVQDFAMDGQARSVSISQKRVLTTDVRSHGQLSPQLSVEVIQSFHGRGRPTFFVSF